MGIPVVASDLPALAEVISASGAGRLAEPESDQALAAAILGLADDQTARQELGSHGREYAVGHHTSGRANEAIRSALAPLLG